MESKPYRMSAVPRGKLYVVQCTLDLHIADCQSLKDKRRVIKSIKQRLKNRYNVSVCEFGDLSYGSGLNSVLLLVAMTGLSWIQR